MSKTKFLTMVMWIFLLMPLYKMNAQELSGNELNLKEKMAWRKAAKFGLFMHWGNYLINAGPTADIFYEAGYNTSCFSENFGLTHTTLTYKG